jgi:t-SNARE complex subunit (syntaxin)
VLAELHQMFLDFALLTEEQGELLDQIESQVKSASDYIVEGEEELKRASVLQQKLRKKQCCIIITCLVIIGIIVAIVIATQTAQGKLAVASVKGRRRL